MPLADIEALAALNTRRWACARLLRDFRPIARRLMATKSRYQAVAAKTGVPWFIVAVVHERKSSQSWTRSLAQGDPWNEISKHVPAGRGPFSSWEEAAVDALADCAPYLARHTDWSLGPALAALEAYNGLGYAARGVPSPYVWAGTDQYKSGKFVRDGVYDPGVVDSQPGCAGLLMAMMGIDPTIAFSDAAPHPAQPPMTMPPSFSHPQKGSIGAFIVSILATIFRRK